jgi:hypothetical protein
MVSEGNTSSNYIDKGLRALTQLRDLLTPHGIHIVQVRELTNLSSKKDAVEISLSVQVPLVSASESLSDSSNDKNFR